MFVPSRRFGILTCLTALALGGLLSCEDSEQDQKRRAAQFTTSTKAAPNPQRESLENFIRTDKLQDGSKQSIPLFKLVSEYKGEDMHQLTGVSGRSLLLCFTAPWCDYSKKMAKSLTDLAKLEQGALQVILINADEYPALAEQYELSKVPTTILYVEGVRLRRIEGAYTAKSLQKYLQKTLSVTTTPAS
ncbi:MAG: thioredoxin family protein [Akkermansia sp.]